MKCRVCDRAAEHWQWFNPARPQRVHLTAPTCSRICMDIWKDRRRMVDASEHELAAMAAASDAGGAYIEALGPGRTDMARWTPEQWAGFIEAVCGGYVDSLVAQQAALTAAVAKVSGA